MAFLGVPAQAGDLNRADEILESYLAAVGGRELFAAQDTLYLKVRSEAAALGVYSIVETWEQGRGTRVLHTIIPAQPKAGVRKQLEETWGWDGSRAWKRRADGTCSLLAPNEAAVVVGATTITRLVDYANVYSSRRYVGESTFAGRETFDIEVEDLSGRSVRYHFDRLSGLPLGGIEKVETGASGRLVPREFAFDWAEGGSPPRFPRAMRTTSMGMETVETWEKAILGLKPAPAFAKPCPSAGQAN